MRLSTKILLLVAVTSIIGFGSIVWLMAAHEQDELLTANRERSESVAAAVATGIQNVMLTGKAVLAEEFVQDCRQLPGVEDLRIYDQQGVEVFLAGEKRVGEVSAKVRAVLASGVADRADNGLVRPLANAQECRRCHEEKGPWRGAVKVTLASDKPQDVVFRFALAALKNVMTSGEADETAAFLEALEALPEVERALVLSPDGVPVFGDDDVVLEPELAKAAEAVLASGGGRVMDEVHLYAVPNEPSCHVCHGDDHEVRGVIAVEMAAVRPEQLLDTASALFEKSLIQLMISERGNSLESYLIELRGAKEIEVAALYGPAGEEIYPPHVGEPVKGVRTDDRRVHTVLASGEQSGFVDGAVYTQLMPMENDVRCQACHGSDHEIRGVVRIDTDLSQLEKALSASVKRSSITLVVFVLASSLVLFVFFRRLFVRPVVEIARVAHDVGEGRLDVEVTHRSGDEVGRLAHNMNEMILGLRSKLMMERFVGDHTRRMIHDSVRGAAEHRAPVRRSIAVLFSDVRGFTSYSEANTPERVIETLNTYLGLQTEVVEKYGGYVDKFVGDEIMALFEGENKEQRAAEAALAMLEAVAGATVEDRMEVGIGINAGDVVFGSTGSKERQDYTVIGDVVNLGARLCSAAGAGVILMSGSARHAVDAGLEFSDARSLAVKGKAERVEVYELLGKA